LLSLSAKKHSLLPPVIKVPSIYDVAAEQKCDCYYNYYLDDDRLRWRRRQQQRHWLPCQVCLLTPYCLMYRGMGVEHRHSRVQRICIGHRAHGLYTNGTLFM